jgi:hypothetical protein
MGCLDVLFKRSVNMEVKRIGVRRLLYEFPRLVWK